MGLSLLSKNEFYKVALISGSFIFANALKDKLGADYAMNLELKEGKLTGRVTGAIINAEQKAILLKLITQQETSPLEQVVAGGTVLTTYQCYLVQDLVLLTMLRYCQKKKLVHTYESRPHDNNSSAFWS